MHILIDFARTQYAISFARWRIEFHKVMTFRSWSIGAGIVFGYYEGFED